MNTPAKYLNSARKSVNDYHYSLAEADLHKIFGLPAATEEMCGLCVAAIGLLSEDMEGPKHEIVLNIIDLAQQLLEIEG